MVHIKVREGILEGELIENEFGGTFYSFKGIPYAEPPVGDLRFKAPQPAKSWDGIRMAKEFGPICYQFDPFTKQKHTNSSEDCLYLNVYTPEIKPDKPLPVMFYIHGGALISGDGNDTLYGPEFLVRHGVILVTFNYRLEALGFLCLDTEDIPGNAGMKDQVAALRWVKNNISNFGGDPENVTIFGESAGGSSVFFQLVSPMSKGLFKRAISQSSGSDCWMIQPRERAIALARKLGLVSDDDKELYEFFKSLPVESLVQLDVPIFTNEIVKGDNRFAGIVSEKQFGDNERFFYGDIYDAYRNNIHEGVEVIAGYTEDEGLVMFLLRGLEKSFELLNNLCDSLIPKDIEWFCSLRDKFEVTKRFKRYYFQNDIPLEKQWEQLVRFLSFEMFKYGILQWVKICASRRKNNVYFYKFTCKTKRNIFAYMIGLTKLIGEKKVACHGDDLFYIFPAKNLHQKLDTNSNTFQMIENVTKLWTNFAKYGNPTPDDSLGVRWPTYSVEKQEYLDIGNQLVLGTEPDKEEAETWEGIYRQYLPHRVYDVSS